MKKLIGAVILAILFVCQLQLNAQQGKIEIPSSFYKHLGGKLKYPKAAADKGLQGTSLVTFKVDDGKVADVNIKTSLGEGFDTEVVNNILSYQSFSEFTKGSYALPVKFMLQGDGVSKTLKNNNTNSPAGFILIDEIVIVAYAPSQETGANANKDKSPIKLLGKLSNITIKDADGKSINIDSGEINAPLYIINGKHVQSGALNEINPDLISDIQVLKDSSAVQIYGGQAKNGAILIRLKNNASTNEEKTPKIILRGKSLSDKQPLYKLDGKTIDEYDMKMIDPNDISNITILKNDSAVKKYGLAAVNGVVEIELKPKEILIIK